ncbi:MAG: N-acetylneuraminate synthase [Syntrophales bacterium LBB04]|nr:N-acetylneuraminate synthase [Syntrophales bacterium LBB04]
MNKTFIIAEAGVNHNGSLEMAMKMVDVAVAAGADAVKFQTFKADNVIAAKAPKADYQKETNDSDESQLEMLKKLELDEAAHIRLYQYCRHKGIQFLSAPFDLESVDLLGRIGLGTFKIPSGEITNLPYLRKLGALKKRLIMSSGMAYLGEIEDALNVLIGSGTPWENITVLHCNTEYPTSFEDVNLRAMLTIQSAFPGIAVGYSDHTNGIEVSIAAVAIGATVIEKHFTLDRNLPGPDHQASLEPHELSAMISSIRNIEKAMGSGIKKPSRSELKNKFVVSKSIIAAFPIKKGQTFTEMNITTKRPGNGISPMRWDEIIGSKAGKDYKVDEIINE